MFVPGDNDVINCDEPHKTGEAQTDRVNGEYHYKNGYTQKIYSDAHYVREEDSTVPPRYYTPPEKPAKEPKEPKLSRETGRRAGAFAKTLCLCLVCALLGGIGGAAFVSSRVADRVDALEQSFAQLQAQPAIGQGSPLAASVSEGEQDVLPASAVYDLACQQVVGVTSEVNYTNFFGMSSSSAVSGTGFIVAENGYIITNYHVIEYAYTKGQEVTVILHDGTRYAASIVGVEAGNDIAVLKIDAANLSAAAFGDSDSLSVGETVYAVGNPLGELEFSMSTGHVSALDRAIKTGESADSINMFQIDAAVNSGNSGGPVYNTRGQVIGVVTAKYSDTGVEGIGFAIPINDAAGIAHDLVTKGYVTGKAYLGVRLDERYNSLYSQYYGMPLGAYVYSVEAGSSAEAAGVQPGDIITRMGDAEISSYSDLRTAVRRFSAGETTELGLYREGENLTLSVTLGEQKPESMSDSPAKLDPAG
ncbi:MAG: S1C family serine protease [Candidatus Limivicinus sp.]